MAAASRPDRPPAAGSNVSPDQFHVGDRVQVRAAAPGSRNPRTPHYLRGWTGTVLHCHGVIDNPLDHHDRYPTLYSVLFTLPDTSHPEDEVLADIHEEWLVSAA